MKKHVLALIAAASLMFAACESSEQKSAKSDSNEPIIAVDPSVTLDKTFENENFSVKFPAALNLSDPSSFHASDESGYVSFGGDFFSDGPTLDQLKFNSEGMAGALRAIGDTPEAPILKGKSYVIKSKTERGLIKWTYCVMKADKVGIAGSLEYPEDQAAEYEKYVGAVINSIKFK